MLEATSPNKICFRLMIHVMWDLGTAILRNVGNHSPKHKTSHPRLQGVWSSAWRSFRREVAENCARLDYYTESSKSLPTFRGNLSALSSSPYRGFGITCRSHLQVLTEASG